MRRKGFRALPLILSPVLALILGGVQLVAQDGPGSCGWRPGDVHKVHWPQLPDLGFTGVDVALTGMTLADDFWCTATGPIRDIHLWGSFLDDVLPLGGPDSLTFELSIYSDVPAVENTPSQPGQLLWTRTFKPGQYASRLVHDGPQDWVRPFVNLYLPGNHRQTYQYDFCVTQEPFVQEAGKVYWLAVTESSVTVKYTFGCRTASRRFHWGGDVMSLQSGKPGWLAMSYPQGHTYAGETTALAFVIADGNKTLPQYDLGDAPDRRSHIAGKTMTAYGEGVMANFPTAYDTNSPVHGPVHQRPRERFYLGEWVSYEAEADIGFDEDMANNLDPANDAADRDGGDDGLQLPAVMPVCGQTTLNYTVTVATPGAEPAYVNIWCDWNRDGDWNDTLECPDGTQAPEWAVQNQQIAVAEAGVHTFTTPAFQCWHPAIDELDPIWLRVTLAEQPWQAGADAPVAGGVGPAGGYKYGETEDYYIRPVTAPTVAYDFGDAPIDVAGLAAGYPTLLIDDGARHVIAGPWLGDANDKPDAEADGQPDPDALGDDNQTSDDENGVCIPPLVAGETAGVTIQVSGGGVVQGWIDFNGDHSWQATEEVCNSFLADGVHVIYFTVPNGAFAGQTFARFRISRKGGLGPEGLASDGEVEDYEVSVTAAPDVKRWCQLPDLTPYGIDIRVDNSDGSPRIIADDFGCSSRGKLTHVRLWGSWQGDKKGVIKKIHLRIHPDDPVGAEGADKQNKYSKPGPEILWQKDFDASEIQEKLCHTVRIAGEWWMDPAANEAIPGGDTQVWQLDMNVNPETSFEQEGSADKPMIYWLSVEVEAADGQFGWKTRQWPEHYMDDAVFGAGLKGNWRELYYPHGHEHYDVETNSIDMAFSLQFAPGAAPPTSVPTTITQCPTVQTLCPAVTTQCPVMPTLCPPAETACPPMITQCPVVETVCPSGQTQCPASATQCPVAPTKCPAAITECHVAQTLCPAVETQCPPAPTSCPLILTSCPPVETRCPMSRTQCPLVSTQCPVTITVCAGCPNFRPDRRAAGDDGGRILASLCPSVEADCPTVADYLLAATP